MSEVVVINDQIVPACFPSLLEDDEWELVERSALGDLARAVVAPLEDGTMEAATKCSQYLHSLQSPQEVCEDMRTPIKRHHELCNARSQSQLSRRQFVDSVKQVQASSASYTKAITQYGQDPAMKRSVVNRFQQQALQDEALLTQRLQTLTNAEQSLSELERRQVEQETLLGTRYAPITQVSSRNESQEGSAPRDLEAYFNLAGKAFVLNERLTEVHLEQEDLGAKFGMQYGDVLSLKQSELAHALGAVNQQLEAQKSKCLARGLDPEHFRYRHMSM